MPPVVLPEEVLLQEERYAAKIEEMEREVFHLYGPGEDNLDAITKKITQEIDAE